MYKENGIFTYYKLLCFIIFVAVILFLKSYISLMFLLLFFCLSNNKENSLINLGLFFMSIVFLSLGIYVGNIFIIKIAIIIDYAYYFTRSVKKENLLHLRKLLVKDKYTFRKLYKEYTMELENDVKNNLDEEIKKGIYEEDSVKEISNNIHEKIDLEVNEKIKTNYLRFYKVQNDHNISFDMDYFNMIYITMHLFILLLCIMVG